MNDYEAMEAISEVLERYFRGELLQLGTLAAICTIVGQNKITHNEVKETK